MHSPPHQPLRHPGPQTGVGHYTELLVLLEQQAAAQIAVTPPPG